MDANSAVIVENAVPIRIARPSRARTPAIVTPAATTAAVPAAITTGKKCASGVSWTGVLPTSRIPSRGTAAAAAARRWPSPRRWRQLLLTTRVSADRAQILSKTCVERSTRQPGEPRPAASEPPLDQHVEPHQHQHGEQQHVASTLTSAGTPWRVAPKMNSGNVCVWPALKIVIT